MRMDETRFVADLPNLRLEVVRREDATGDLEIRVRVQAVPPQDAWRRWLVLMTPLGYWQAVSAFAPWSPLMRLAWAPRPAAGGQKR
jgi:hypothetical protein